MDFRHYLYTVVGIFTIVTTRTSRINPLKDGLWFQLTAVSNTAPNAVEVGFGGGGEDAW